MTHRCRDFEENHTIVLKNSWGHYVLGYPDELNARGIRFSDDIDLVHIQTIVDPSGDLCQRYTCAYILGGEC